MRSAFVVRGFIVRLGHFSLPHTTAKGEGGRDENEGSRVPGSIQDRYDREEWSCTVSERLLLTQQC